MPHVPLAFVSAEVCRRLVDVEQVVRRINEVYLWEAKGEVMYAPGVALRMFHAESSFKTHTKAVILPRLAVAGVRVVGYCVQEDGSGPSSPQSTRLVMLMDLESGSPLAIVDEHYNYTLRTAASVAVAAVHLSPSRPVLGMVGAGGVAQAVARVFPKVLPIEEIYVTSRRESSRQAFAQKLAAELKLPVHPLESIEEVVARCNLVATATTSRETLLEWDQIRPGMLLCALGSFELSAQVYRGAAKVLVDDWEQTRTAHDMRGLVESGAFRREDLYAELAEVVSGARPGRERDNEVIVVRTEGKASQDVALAHWIYQQAIREGLVVPFGGQGGS